MRLEKRLDVLAYRYPLKEDTWSYIEKETLKKYMLQFGHGRWKKIRKMSQLTCKILSKKTDSEMRIYSNGWLFTLFG